MDSAGSLFETVKENVLQNLNLDNVTLLSAIARVEGSDKYDFHSIDDTLAVIHAHFGKEGDHEKRWELFQTFSSRLVVENVEQITSKYNKVLDNVRTYFPEFNLVKESHNPFFGENSLLSCEFHRCTGNEIETISKQHDPLSHIITKEDLDEEKNIYAEFYEEEYTTNTNVRASRLEYPMGAFSSVLRQVLDVSVYANNGFVKINDLLRCNRDSSSSMDTMIDWSVRFFSNVVLPYHYSRDITIYRGDGQTVSSDTLVTKGFYSGSVSLFEMGKFVRDGGRMIQINIPAGTPFIPVITQRDDEGEIVLLPGTSLTKRSEMRVKEGHFAEYDVTGNPPELTPLQEATLLKFAIPSHLKELSTSWMLRNRKHKKILASLPEERGGSTVDEMTKFFMNLVNTEYGGDW